MALLICNLMMGTPADWRAAIHAELPDLEVRFWPDAGDPADIEYLAFTRPDPDDWPAFPNLKAMLTRQAGVDGFIGHPGLPDVPLSKLEPEDGDPMMTEYVVMHVLRLHRNMPTYRERQARREWREVPQKRPEDRTVGFLGYGVMARKPARILRGMGFDVAAWTRTSKPGAEIPVYAGPGRFDAILERSDIVVCLLPLTGETRGILNAGAFSKMPKGGMVINIGRGEHVVTGDLIAALDSSHLYHAALDAHAPEPLPPDSPLWDHPGVTVMPHVARRPNIAQLAPQIVANIRRCEAGEPLLQEVDRVAGY
ncbi:MAG: glyoxylate/hydroxypyruvate reductase A [Rhodospirillaceae bacterium]|nr:glyoxylate/hydroxypyruvate reductase A [Rhodospirillaceae bacterium]